MSSIGRATRRPPIPRPLASPPPPPSTTPTSPRPPPLRLAPLPAEHDAAVAARAAYVDAQRAGLTGRGGGPGAAGRPAGGAAQDGQDRVGGGLLEAREPAAGLHHRGLRQPGVPCSL